jgi:hypothetical protein
LNITAHRVIVLIQPSSGEKFAGASNGF